MNRRRFLGLASGVLTGGGILGSGGRAWAQAAPAPRPGAKPGASAPNRFYMYGVIARLAMVAASYELEATDPNAEVYE